MQQPSTIPQSSPYASTPTTPQSSPPSQNKSGWRSAMATILILVAAPLLALGLTTFVFQSYEVDGPSMETTLQNQDRLIVWKVPKTIARITNKPFIPERGEIVIFIKHGLSEFGDGGGDKQLIKRVVGLPGDRVVVREGVMTIYNQKHPDGFNPDTDGGYGNVLRQTPGNVDLVVPEGQLFVSGDNRTNSLDSRSFGTISADDLVGVLKFRLIPISKARVY